LVRPSFPTRRSSDLFDAREGAAQAARDSLAATFAKLVAKGKITRESADAALALLKPIARIEEMAGCDMVVEAIVEKLDDGLDHRSEEQTSELQSREN